VSVSSDALSDPLVSAGLLAGLAGLILLLGLALQAGSNRRRGVPPLRSTRPAGSEAIKVAPGQGDGGTPVGARDFDSTAWLPGGERWKGEIETRIERVKDDVDTRIERAVQIRVEEVQQRLDTRLNQVEAEFDTRIEAVEDDLDTGIDEIDERILVLTERIDEGPWGDFDSRIGTIEAKIEAIDVHYGEADVWANNHQPPNENERIGEPTSGNGTTHGIGPQPQTHTELSGDYVDEAIRQLDRASTSDH
jgi:hypothetical protein